MTTKLDKRQAPAQAPLPSLSYRYDLDGLRGFSIALVVLFHVFVGRVSGGVDVFLLLSGYFFMGAQLRYAMRPNPSLNPWWPFWRTARRLLPALAVVLAATYGGIRLLAPEMMNGDLAKQFTASVLYYQNYELTSQDAAYAAAGSHTSPLQHLWSMSVQGQFYLFAIASGILVAWLVTRVHLGVARVRRGVIFVLSIITVLSFAYASRFGFVGTPANYYALPSRLWELSFGALLAMLTLTDAIPHRLRTFTAGLGVVMIAITGAIIPTSLAFPGPAALIPLLGAALVVMSGADNAVARLLASAPMTWLGKVAYSLYLWHWPLLILLTVYLGQEEPSVALGILVIALSLALAHLTYTFVEDPMRQHGKRPKKTDQPVRRAKETLGTMAGRARAVGGVAIAVLLAGVLSIQPLFARQVNTADHVLDAANYPGVMAHFGADTPDVPPMPDPHFIAEMYPPTAETTCMIFLDQPADLMPRPDCVYGDVDSEVTVVLFGGSHAEPWIIPLDRIGKERGFRVVPFLRQQCPLVLDDPDTVTDECAEWSQNAFAKIVELQPDLTISSSTRPVGFAGEGSVGPDVVPLSYASVWDSLRLNDIPFLGIRDNPWVFNEEGIHMDPNECVIDTEDVEACATRRSTVYAPVDPATDYLFPENKQWALDTADWYCGEELCPPVIGNVFVYRDQNHISNAYAETITPLMWEKIKEIFDALEIPYTPDEDPEGEPGEEDGEDDGAPDVKDAVEDPEYLPSEDEVPGADQAPDVEIIEK